MTNKRTILLFLVGCLCLVIVQGQSTIPATGGNATGTGGSVSYSIGQIVYTTSTGAGGSVSQGVQQPFEISIVTALEKTEDITLECKVYPNPTKGVVRLVILSYENDNMRFKLHDINGVLLQDKRIEGKETDISMDDLSPAIYFLKVIIDNKEIKTFKVIKN